MINYISVDPTLELERTEDHIDAIRRDFDRAHNEGHIGSGMFELGRAKRFYPNHPTTISMEKDYKA